MRRRNYETGKRLAKERAAAAFLLAAFVLCSCGRDAAEPPTAAAEESRAEEPQTEVTVSIPVPDTESPAQVPEREPETAGSTPEKEKQSAEVPAEKVWKGTRDIIFEADGYYENDGDRITAYYRTQKRAWNDFYIRVGEKVVQPFYGMPAEGVFHVVLREGLSPKFLCTAVTPLPDEPDAYRVYTVLYNFEYNWDTRKNDKIKKLYSDEWKTTDPGDHYLEYLKMLVSQDFRHSGSLTQKLPEPSPGDYRNLIDECSAEGLKENFFIFADSAEKELCPEDLEPLTPEIIRLGRNEIYARKGYIFSDPEVKAYFEGQAWYQGSIPAGSFDESMLTAVEKANIEQLKKTEWENTVYDFLCGHTDMLVYSFEDARDMDLEPLIVGCQAGMSADEAIMEMSKAGFDLELEVSWITGEVLDRRLRKATGYGLDEMRTDRKPDIPEKDLYCCWGYGDVAYPEALCYYGYTDILSDDGKRCTVRFRYTAFGPKYSEAPEDCPSECIVVLERNAEDGFHIVSNQRVK